MPSSWQNLTNGTAPPASWGSSFAYDPAGGYDLLFGGEDAAGLLGNTWSYEAGSWTELSCPCPSARAFATMAFDPARDEMVLFGGLAETTNSQGAVVEAPVSDTWAWNAGSGTWSDISNAVGTPPTSRYSGSMAWSANASALVLFGGDSGSSALNDTWELGNGNWTSLSESVAPAPRWGAGFANSSEGYDLLFGGESLTDTYGDTWTFNGTAWAEIPVCGGCGPSARAYPLVADIPATGNMVVFGGSGPAGLLDDAWVFTAASPTTGPAIWTLDPSAPAPPAAWAPAAASDFTRGIIVEFGGDLAAAADASNLTWGYFRLYAVLSVSVPEVRQGVGFTISTLPLGGDAPFSFVYTGLPPGCSTTNASIFVCTSGSWGIYRLTVSVVDARGRFTEANASVQVDPLDTQFEVLSEYSGFFFTGLSVNNTFGVVASVFGETPTSVTASFGNGTLTLSAQPGGWWNATVAMGDATPGATFEVTALFANWTLHGALTTSIEVVASPSWLTSIADFPTVVASFAGGTSGDWNQSYTLTYTEFWGLGALTQFNIPVSFLAGAFNLIPVPTATLTVASSGAIALKGGIMYPPPGLTFGPFNFQIDFPGSITAAVSVAGHFEPTLGPDGVYQLNWSAAWLNASLGGSLNTSIDLAGITVPDVGTIGVSLELMIAPSVALSLLLGPAGPGQSGFLPNLPLVIEHLYAALTIVLTATITVGISHVITISGGGNLSIALLFGSSSPYFDGVWLNGSMFLQVSLLIWTFTWTFLGPGTLYSWSADPPTASRPGGTLPAASDLGANWTVLPRYYNSSTYDALDWSAGASLGTAIADLFPEAGPSLSGGGGVATLVYTSDNVGAPVGSLRMEALAIDPSARTIARLPNLAPAGNAVAEAAVGTGAGGTTVGVIDTVPTVALSGSSPSGITGFKEESAVLDPGASSWSNVEPLVSWGYPQSPVLSTCGGETEVATLVSPTLFPGPTSPEYLLIQNAGTGALLANLTATGSSAVGAFSCADGLAVLENASGAPTVVNLATGSIVPVAVTPPYGATLAGVEFVSGSAGTVALRYTSPSRVWAVLADLTSGAVLASIELPLNATAVEATAVGSSTYLFVQESNEVVPFVVNGSAAAELSGLTMPGLRSFAAVLVGSSFVVEGVATSGPHADPVYALDLGFVNASTGPAPPPPVSPTSSTPAPPPTLAYVEIGVLAALVAATAVVVLLRRRSSTRSNAEGDPAPPTPPGPEPPEAG